MAIKELAAALVLHAHNMRVLHWNVTGVDFDPVHSLMGDYYDKLGSLLDDVTELCVSVGVEPMGLHEALELLDKETSRKYMELSGTSKFTSKECFTAVETIFKQFIEIYAETYKDPLPESVINLLQEQQQWFRKECEFKNKRRLQ